MNKKTHLPSRFFLVVFIVIVFHIFLVSSALGESVKGKVEVAFETGFFRGGEPDDESKAKALEKAKLAAWKKYTSGFIGAKIMSYG